MSSARSPDLRLELRTDWRVLAALIAWAGLAITCIWFAALPLAPAGAATSIVLLLAGRALASQVHGARRILVWSSEGRWLYENPDGTLQLLELSPVSRGFPGGALLVFQQTRSIRWAVLLAHARDSDNPPPAHETQSRPPSFG